jgi:hypothetical protein
MKKRLLLALAPVAALPLVLGSGAGAAETWETFGSVSVIGRGQWLGGETGHDVEKGSAQFDIFSMTKPHVDKVRATITDGTYRGKSTVLTALYCHDTGNRVWNNTDRDYREVSFPQTFTWNPPAWVNICQIKVLVFHAPMAGGGTNGPLVGTLQATYT